MNEIYCIYSDKFVSYNKSNLEHIIPLSLGGCDELTLRVDREINSMLGHQVDGRLTNDYLISSIRRHKNYRGHTSEIPKTVLKKTKIGKTNKPVQIIFQGKESYFYDPINKRKMLNSEVIGESFNSTIKMDKYARILFIAKTLLSSGYFIYGDIFKDNADHDSLRKLMNSNLGKNEGEFNDLPLTVIDPLYHPEENDIKFIEFMEKICKSLDCSCIIFLYTSNSIVGSVGIGGNYIGSINFNANVMEFPNDGKFNCGHIIGIQDNLLRRSSFNFIASKLTNQS